MRQVNRFRNAVDKVLSRSNDLVMALNELSVQASEINGEELVTTICNGEEIEFSIKTISMRQVRRCRNDLVMALNELAVQASEIYGEELVAICNGEEIEFRVNGDADSIIPLSDIFEKL